jgi:hypothetical protein
MSFATAAERHDHCHLQAGQRGGGNHFVSLTEAPHRPTASNDTVM